jgi:putative tryptophan/tyrosine transport system substrate-binding protein
MLMRRREFIGVLGGAAAWPVVAWGQQPAIPVIGYLSSGPANANPKFQEAFRRGLSEQGYNEGRNVTIEYRWADNHYDRLPALASDLVSRRVSVIVGNGLVSSLAAKKETDTIPIVFNIGADPIKSGLVTSFNRPNANATGVAALIESLGPKRLGLLHELLPNVGVVGILFNANNPTAEAQVEEIKEAARSIALSPQVVSVHDRGENLEEAFSILNQQRAGALLVVPDPMLIDNRDRIVALSANHAIPTIYPLREFAEAGGLISYGTDFFEAMRQSGSYAGQILKGVKPADLPVVQSVKLELVINLKTAKVLGLTIPPTLLARADQVIE